MKKKKKKINRKKKEKKWSFTQLRTILFVFFWILGCLSKGPYLLSIEGATRKPEPEPEPKPPPTHARISVTFQDKIIQSVITTTYKYINIYIFLLPLLLRNWYFAFRWALHFTSLLSSLQPTTTILALNMILCAPHLVAYFSLKSR